MTENKAAPLGQDPIEDAIFILTEEADALSDCHTRTIGDWAGEDEFKARYDWIQAVIAGLSKLRAPVADELPEWKQISAKLARGETLTPLEFFIHENEPAGDDADDWRDQLDAALASAPVAKPSPASQDFAQEVWAAAQSPHGEPMEKSVSRVASLLAEWGAPVAGEARPVAKRAKERPSDESILDAWDEHVTPSTTAYLIDDADKVAFARAVLADAAPQASEAVCSCPTGDGSLRHPCAVHPPGDKDGGDCARGAGDEPIAWESTTPAYFKFITDSRYRKFSPAVRKWYRPYRCSTCAALSPTQPTEQGERDA
jgi:hypothetical protein